MKKNDDHLKLENQLCFLFYAATKNITNSYRALLDHLELTYPQYLVMLVLWERDGITVNEIGEKIELDSGTLTPMLKRLEKRGIIFRKRDSLDERKVIISLSEQGKKMKDKAYGIPEALFCKSGLAISEAAVLKKQLSKLITSLKSSVC